MYIYIYVRVRHVGPVSMVSASQCAVLVVVCGSRRRIVVVVIGAVV